MANLTVLILSLASWSVFATVPTFSFQRIEADSFTMGSPKTEKGHYDNEEGKNGKPVQVKISKAFEMTTTEVTQLQWVMVMGQRQSFSFSRGKTLP